MPFIGKTDEEIIERLKTFTTPVFLCINKIDSVSKETVLETIELYRKAYDFKEIIPISAYENTNCRCHFKMYASLFTRRTTVFPK